MSDSTNDGKPKMVAVSGEVVRQHFLNALPMAERFVKGAPLSGLKPYDLAIAHALALTGLCETFGWEPEHFHNLIRTMVDLPAVAALVKAKNRGT